MLPSRRYGPAPGRTARLQRAGQWSGGGPSGRNDVLTRRTHLHVLAPAAGPVLAVVGAPDEWHPLRDVMVDEQAGHTTEPSHVRPLQTSHCTAVGTPRSPIVAITRTPGQTAGRWWR